MDELARKLLADILAVPEADARFIADGIFNYDRALKIILAALTSEPALQDRIAELEADRAALLEKPINLAKMDSVDDELNDRMIAYYWCEQANGARAERDAAQARIAVLEAALFALIEAADAMGWHTNSGECDAALQNARQALQGGTSSGK